MTTIKLDTTYCSRLLRTQFGYTTIKTTLLGHYTDIDMKYTNFRNTILSAKANTRYRFADADVTFISGIWNIKSAEIDVLYQYGCHTIYMQIDYSHYSAEHHGDNLITMGTILSCETRRCCWIYNLLHVDGAISYRELLQRIQTMLDIVDRRIQNAISTRTHSEFNYVHIDCKFHTTDVTPTKFEIRGIWFGRCILRVHMLGNKLHIQTEFGKKILVVNKQINITTMFNNSGIWHSILRAKNTWLSIELINTIVIALIKDI